MRKLTPDERRLQLDTFVDFFVREFMAEIWYIEETGKGNIAKREVSTKTLFYIACGVITLASFAGNSLRNIASIDFLQEGASALDDSLSPELIGIITELTTNKQELRETGGDVARIRAGAGAQTTLKTEREESKPTEGATLAKPECTSKPIDPDCLAVFAHWLGHKIAQRYEHLLIERLSLDPEKALIGLARVGARRCLANLAKTSSMEGSWEKRVDQLLSSLVDDGQISWVKRPLEVQTQDARMWGRDELNDKDKEEKFYVQKAFNGVSWFSAIDRLEACSILPKTEMLTTAIVEQPRYGYAKSANPVHNTKGSEPVGLAEWLGQRLYQPISQADIEAYLSSPEVLEAKAAGRTATISLNQFLHENKAGFPLYGQAVLQEDLKSLDLSCGDFSHVDFSGKKIEGNLSHCSFTGSRLYAVDFRSVCTAPGSNLILSHCEMGFSNLRDAGFEGEVDITQANLTCVDLTNSHFWKVQQIGTCWYKAILTGVSYDGIIKAHDGQIASIIEKQQRQDDEFDELHRCLEALEKHLSLLVEWPEETCFPYPPSDGAGAGAGVQASSASERASQSSGRLEALLLAQEKRLQFGAYCRSKLRQLSSASERYADQIASLEESLARVQEESAKADGELQRQIDDLSGRVGMVEGEVVSLRAGHGEISHRTSFLEHSHAQLRREMDVRVRNSCLVDIDPDGSPIEFQRPMSNPYYTDRPVAQEQLGKYFKPMGGAGLEREVVSLCAHGMGGVGKTQLAGNYYLSTTDRYRLKAWFFADNPDVLALNYVMLAEAVNLGLDEALPLQERAMQVKAWLEKQSEILLVYDNANDPEEVRQYLPERGHHHILITTRNAPWPTTGVIDVGVMVDEEARELLKKSLAGEADDPALINTLIEKLGKLPLALAQAAGYINNTRIGMAAYLRRYEDEKAVLLSKVRLKRSQRVSVQEPYREAEAQAAGLPYEARHEPCWVTFGINYAELSEHSQRLLDLSAYLDGDFIPRWLAQKLLKVDEAGLDDSIVELRAYSLVSVGSEGYAMHRLLQDIRRYHTVEPIPALGQITNVLQQCYADEYNGQRNFSVIRQLVAHLKSAIGHSQRLKEDLSDEGDLKEVGLKHANLLEVLASAQDDLGDATGAKALYAQALEIMERHYGAAHVEVARTQGNLAAALQALGDAAGAKALYAKSLEIMERHYGAAHVVVARTQGGLASALRALGDAAGAKALYAKALEVKKKHYGAAHVEVARTQGDLALALQALGDAAGAKALYAQSLETMERHYGAAHVEVARTQGNLAGVLYGLGDAAGARALNAQSLEIMEHHYGAAHVEVARTQGNLALALQALGDAAGAKALYAASLEIMEGRYGTEYMEVAITQGNLARAMLDLEEARQAITLLGSPLEILKSHYGDSHVDVSVLLNSLGRGYLMLGDLASAQRSAERALEIRQAALPAGHCLIGETMSLLGEIMGAQGNQRQNLDYQQRALDLLAAYYKTHPHIELAKCLRRMAEAQLALGKPVEALESYRDAYTNISGAYGLEHPKSLEYKAALDRLQVEAGVDVAVPAGREGGEILPASAVEWKSESPAEGTEDRAGAGVGQPAVRVGLLAGPPATSSVEEAERPDSDSGLSLANTG